MEFLDRSFAGDTLGSWLLAVILAAVFAAVLRKAQRMVVGRLVRIAQATLTPLDDLLVALVDKTSLLFIVVVSAYAASRTLSLPHELDSIMGVLAVMAMLFQFGLWSNRAVATWLEVYVSRKMTEDAATGTSLRALAFIARVVVWAVLLLLALDNIGIDVTAVIAGLGVGGIAVALAVQNILGDLFASLSIVLDKPFIVGDFIVVGEFMGTIEKVGLKTTRVRSLGGEQLIFSNNDLLQSRIRNYKRMEERRVLFELSVEYGTPAEKLEAIPGWIRGIVSQAPSTRFDRAHFKSFGDSALVFEVVYFVQSGDYNLFMDTQQAINLAIARKFQVECVEFAFPTRTVFVRRSS